MELNCESAILISQDTGEVLYEHNSHEKLRPASVTKVMTILLIMEEIDSGKLSYQDNITCSENASNMGGSQIWLDPREVLTVDEMLKAICVVSANDCTVAMAEHICGSEEVFVDRMNQRAKELGMNDTTFKNCHGIDEDGHETSSYDISIMSRELLTKHPNITKYTTIWMDSLRDGKSGLVNTNKLVKNYEGATGLKTGSTSLALFNLSASATRNDLSLIAVVMRAPTTKDRFSCAKKLLDYGFSNYQYKKFSSEGDFVTDVNIGKGTEGTVALNYASTVGKVMNQKGELNVEQEVVINENIQAPIEEGQKLGEVVFKINGEVEGKTDLVASKTIEKITFLNMTKRVMDRWFCLFR
ncbi:MAG: D-alanyl-D-alanine carboxypeptidase [Clostridia bacterium]|nr:D-alanyl-D-alanine carboxypeptidase [Clostridia bacterium]